MVGDTLKDVKFSGLAWKGNDGFYYSSYDKPKAGSQLAGKTQIHKLFYHKLGTPQSTDKLVFGGEKTPRRYIGAYLTEDERFLVISARQHHHRQRALHPGPEQARQRPLCRWSTTKTATWTCIDNVGSKLYILTNLNAPNNRVVTVDAANPKPANWKTLIPETKNVLNVSTGGGKIFANYLKDATSLIEQYDMRRQEGAYHCAALGGHGRRLRHQAGGEGNLLHLHVLHLPAHHFQVRHRHRQIDGVQEGRRAVRPHASSSRSRCFTTRRTAPACP